MGTFPQSIKILCPASFTKEDGVKLRKWDTERLKIHKSFLDNSQSLMNKNDMVEIFKKRTFYTLEISKWTSNLAFSIFSPFCFCCVGPLNQSSITVTFAEGWSFMRFLGSPLLLLEMKRNGTLVYQNTMILQTKILAI